MPSVLTHCRGIRAKKSYGWKAPKGRGQPREIKKLHNNFFFNRSPLIPEGHKNFRY